MNFKTNMFTLFFFVLACSINIEAVQLCPNLSPCTCQYNSGLYVTCVEEPMEEVKKIFSNLASPIDMHQLTLYIQPSGDSIPEDLLGQSRVTSGLSLQRRPFGSTFLQLTVDPNAFRSSTNSLQSVEMKYLDIGRLNFNFLEDFDKVRELKFYFDINLDQSIPNLPVLPALTTLTFYNSTGLDEAFKLRQQRALQSTGLTTLEAFNCDLADNEISNLLNWVLPSSIQTLQVLSIGSNSLEKIPPQLSIFQSLETVEIEDNNVDLSIPRNSFYGAGISSNISISISSSRVVHVESGAFQGDYSFSKVSLTNNFLTRIEEGVYKFMLQDMSTSEGFIDLNKNPFDCRSDPCHLAWLLRDNRNLLGSVRNARCEDGTSIEDLSPVLFEECSA